MQQARTAMCLFYFLGMVLPTSCNYNQDRFAPEEGVPAAQATQTLPEAVVPAAQTTQATQTLSEEVVPAAQNTQAIQTLPEAVVPAAQNTQTLPDIAEEANVRVVEAEAQRDALQEQLTVAALQAQLQTARQQAAALQDELRVVQEQAGEEKAALQAEKEAVRRQLLALQGRNTTLQEQLAAAEKEKIAAKEVTKEVRKKIGNEKTTAANERAVAAKQVELQAKLAAASQVQLQTSQEQFQALQATQVKNEILALLDRPIIRPKSQSSQGIRKNLIASSLKTLIEETDLPTWRSLHNTYHAQLNQNQENCTNEIDAILKELFGLVQKFLGLVSSEAYKAIDDKLTIFVQSLRYMMCSPEAATKRTSLNDVTNQRAPTQKNKGFSKPAPELPRQCKDPKKAMSDFVQILEEATCFAEL